MCSNSNLELYKIEKNFLILYNTGMKKCKYLIILMCLFLASCSDKKLYGDSSVINMPVINMAMTEIIDSENVDKYEQKALLPVELKRGVNHQIVVLIQQRLMLLGYMDEDKPTTFYGEATEESVKKLQRQVKIEQNGICDKNVYDVLMSKDAPTYETQRGYSGSDISVIQQRLYELSYLLDEDDINGYFGEKTEAAVKAMQKSNKLEQNGKIDLKTLNLLYNDNVVPYTINRESPSYVIKKYQYKLKDLGYYLKEPNGKYDEYFKEAVRQYQHLNSQVVDGMINPSTKFSIDSKYARPYVIYLGDKSNRIRNIQDRLVKLGYIDSNLITGYYGEYTAQAIAIFQKNNNLPITGLVDGVTQQVLDGETAVHAKKVLKYPYQFIIDTMKIRNAIKEQRPEGNVEDLLKVALLKTGSKYVWGMRGPNVFDCSGFVYWCLNQVGVNVSYMTTYSWRFSTQFERVEKFDDLQVGDLIVINGHMGIVADNQTVVDASSSNGCVVHRNLDDWWRQRFMIGFRIFSNEETEEEEY